MKNDCGGCEGKGAHRRWCAFAYGFVAAMYGNMAERLDSMGDSASASKELQNTLWSASSQARAIATAAKERHVKEVQERDE